MPRGRAARAGPRRDRPDSRGPPSSRPCRRPRRPRRRASARGARSASASNQKTCVWPPETTSAANVSGTGAEGPPAPSRKGESACPSMWFTGTKGTESPSARPFPSERPTSRAPTSPGPAVAATAVTSARARAGVGERRVEKGGQVLKVRACRDLGHDAAEAAMGLLLRRNAGGARAGPRRREARRRSRRRTSRGRGRAPRSPSS